MVDSFYADVRKDPLLGPIFDERIQDRWPKHLDIMYRFWQTVLLEEHTYQGSPFMKHATLPVDAEHFGQWFKLFSATVDRHFSGPVAEEAKFRADRMALMFQVKLQHIRSTQRPPLA